jgi:RimJ/RimL family protein N-acetyltransferase
LELVAIEEAGETSPPEPEMIAQVVEAMTQLYRKVGYEPPWIGYLVKEDDAYIGACGFKSPPVNNRVEIAYFTFPEYEGRGVATRIATELVRLALEKMPDVIVAAQTLPESNASTSVLKKLGFELTGTDEDEEVGLVWEWRLPSR